MDYSLLVDLVGKLRLLDIDKNEAYDSVIADSMEVGGAYVGLLCCPDYSFKVDSNGWATYDHKELRNGVGMMAQLYSKAILQLVNEIEMVKGHITIVLYYADNEAFDKKIQTKVGKSTEEFLQSVNMSMIKGQNFYEQMFFEYFSKSKESFKVVSIGMNGIFYNKENLSKANKFVSDIDIQTIDEIVEQRKKVLISLNGLIDPHISELRELAKGQILDRAVVGIKLSEERTKGNKYSILSLTPKSLVPYFNISCNHIPILSLGSKT